MIEESLAADLHSNASCSFNRIEISEQLLVHHKGHHEEILSVLAHEFGHWKLKHLIKYLPLDVFYMFCYSLFFAFLPNDIALLTSFGFKYKSYVTSLFCIFLVTSVSVEVWFGFIYRALSIKDENEADLFAV